MWCLWFFRRRLCITRSVARINVPQVETNQTRFAGMRPCLLLISPHNSYRLAPYLKAAENIGIHVIVVSQGRYSLVSAVADGIHVDFQEIEQAYQQILSSVKEKNILAVIGTDDLTVELASSLSKELGLVHNDFMASRVTTRKDLSRGCLSATDLHVPRFKKCCIQSLIKNPVHGVGYPCVIKPLSLSGSRGVIRANNDHELVDACLRIQSILLQEQLTGEEKTSVLIEEYIPGYEYAFEGLLTDGKLQCLALFDKPDLMQGPFFEETYYITPSRLDENVQQQIHNAVQLACDAYGLQQGPVHAEMRMHDDKVWILEIASRTIGGQCARLLKFSTGLSLEEIVIRHAAGMEVKVADMEQAAGVLMIPITQQGLLRRVEGVLAANKIKYIEDIEISVREGYELIPLPEGFSYLGFIFSKAPTPALAEQALRDAYKEIRVIMSPMLHL